MITDVLKVKYLLTKFCDQIIKGIIHKLLLNYLICKYCSDMFNKVCMSNTILDNV